MRLLLLRTPPGRLEPAAARRGADFLKAAAEALSRRGHAVVEAPAAVGAGAGVHAELVLADHPAALKQRDGFGFGGPAPVWAALDPEAPDTGSGPRIPPGLDPASDAFERRLERLRLEALGPLPRPAVFLDRDGTLTPERGYLGNPAELELLPGVLAGLRAVDALGYALVVVTNQSAIGRGLFSAAEVGAVHARLRILLREGGVELAGLFVCPHHPEADCPCRKPKPGLLHQAIDALGLATAGSWMVGDHAKDMAAARAAGVRGLLVRTGWGASQEEAARAAGLTAEDVVSDLGAAAARIAAAGPISAPPRSG
jgi:histidinol-phosphate phosphatase family protein